MNTPQTSTRGDPRDRKPRILDTSAILSREISYIAAETYVPGSVIGEIRKGAISRNIESVISSISVRDPDPRSIGVVLERSKETGDFKRLTRTDIEVVALGLELSGIVVTDDYSMQNVCLSLGIEFAGVDLPVITKAIVWGYRCTGCGRYYDQKKSQCPVCGHKLKYYPKRAEKRD